MDGLIMKILTEEKDAIVEAVSGFYPDSEIYLFGSRADDFKRGGDIDVLIRSDLIDRRALTLIEEQIFPQNDEQKIDFVLENCHELMSFCQNGARTGGGPEMVTAVVSLPCRLNAGGSRPESGFSDD